MKKSTKKLVSVLLASAMAAGMLAGCGSGNGKDVYKRQEAYRAFRPQQMHGI